MYASLSLCPCPIVPCVLHVLRVPCVFLRQVPLDQILTTQRDVLALQHVIQRELTAAHGRLQTVATGASQASQPPPLLLPDWSTGGCRSSAAPCGLNCKSPGGQPHLVLQIGTSGRHTGSSNSLAGAGFAHLMCDMATNQKASSARAEWFTDAARPCCAVAGMNESLLLQLGKLPRLAPAGGGEDTDRDDGSEATDVEDLAAAVAMDTS